MTDRHNPSESGASSSIGLSTAAADLEAWQSLVHEWVTRRPAEFARHICEAMVAEPDSATKLHPTLAAKYRSCAFLARVVLDVLDEKFKDEPGEYIQVAQWIEHEFRGCVDFSFLNYEHYRDARSSIDLINTLMEPLADWLSTSVTDATVLVFHGVPLYERRADSYVLVEDDVEEAVYLKQRGSRYEVVASNSLPQWAFRFHFQVSHLAAHSIFFPHEADPKEHEVDVLRKALRSAIGLAHPSKDQAVAAFSSQSRLLQMAHLVVHRYYGPNFQLFDSTTWPRQKDVVTWLREAHGLSEREAQAVDIVCRPDSLRGK